MKRILAIAVLLVIAASAVGRSSVSHLTRVKGAACPVTLTPDTLYGLPGGEFNIIKISASPYCTWQAVSNNGFISAMHAEGQGDGEVIVMTWGHNLADARVGTITINDQTYTVIQAGNYRDVTQFHPFYFEISRLHARAGNIDCGYVSYCPEANATREQMAVIIIKALGMQYPPPPMTQRFVDVLPSRPSYAFVEELAKRGITSGCGGGNFCPDQPITREQMAVFLIRVMGISPPRGAAPRFVDVSADRFGYDYINELANRGLTAGCGMGNYCPDGFVTRGQMAAFLARSLGLR